jgi:hypothetical protein
MAKGKARLSLAKERLASLTPSPSRAEIPDQVRYDERGTYLYAKEGSTGKEKHASGGGSSLRKDDEEEHTGMLWKAATAEAGSASGDPESSSG